MIALWMIYGTLVGLLMWAAARAAESSCRSFGVPARWCHIAGMTAIVVLVGLAPLRHERRDLPGATSETVGRIADGSTEASASLPHFEGAPAGIGSIPWPSEWVAAGLLEARDNLSRLPAGLDLAFAVGWSGASILLLSLFLWTLGEGFRRARVARPTSLQGTRVRVSPDTGPCVVGLFSPEIVIPEWVLDRPEDEQRLLLAHEREHVRAGDHWMLLLANILTIAMPWLIPLWMMSGRLRLAIEFDCDARVLRAAPDRHRYGAMLIAVAGRSRKIAPAFPSIVSSPSNLERRLRRMTDSNHAQSMTRIFGTAVLLVVSAGTAVGMSLPDRLDTGAQRARSDTAILSSSGDRSVGAEAEEGVQEPKPFAESVDAGALSLPENSISAANPEGPSEPGPLNQTGSVRAQRLNSVGASDGTTASQVRSEAAERRSSNVSYAFEVTSDDENVPIRIHLSSGIDPSRIQVEGEAVWQGASYLATTPFRVLVDSDVPFNAQMISQGAIFHVQRRGDSGWAHRATGTQFGFGLFETGAPYFVGDDWTEIAPQ